MRLSAGSLSRIPALAYSANIKIILFYSFYLLDEK